MDAKRYAAEAGVTEAEAERILAEAMTEKERIDRLNNDEFLNGMEKEEKKSYWKILNNGSKKHKKDDDPMAELKEVMREDERLADKAVTLSMVAITLGTISLVLSLLRALKGI